MPQLFVLNSNIYPIILHLGASVISALILLIASPFALTILGSNSGNSAVIVAITMIGLMTGQSGRFSINQVRTIFISAGCFGILLYFLYSPLMILTASNSFVRTLMLLYIIILPFCSGVLISKAIYNNIPFATNYFFHNLLCFFSVILFIGFQSELGMALPHIVIGILLLAVTGATFIRKVKTSERQLNSSLINREALFLGLISGGYTACVLQSIFSWILPVGFEFSVYLSCVFLFLAVAAISKSRRLLKMGLNPVWPLVLFTVLLCLIIGGPNSVIWFDPISLISLFPNDFNLYYLQVILFITVLLIPYMAFSFILPALETSTKTQNSLFSLSCGNTVSLLFFSLAVPELDIQTKLLILFFLAGLHHFLFVRTLKISFFLALILGISLNIILLKNGDARAATQAARLFQRTDRSTYQTFETLLSRPYSLENLRFFQKKGFETSYMYINEHDSHYLGLDGYIGRMHRKKDFYRAKLAAEFIRKEDIRRVLVLGLGSQVILEEISSELKKITKEGLTIDILDNFQMYENIDFRNVLLRDFEFRWPQKNFTLFSEDAFTFLSKKKYSAPYDLIVSNLTSPYQPSSNKLYTSEFRKILVQAMTNKGIFITEFFSNKPLTCLDIREFGYSYFSSSDYKNLALILSNEAIPEFSGKEMNIFLSKNECDKLKNLSLKYPFVSALGANKRLIHFDAIFPDN